MRILVAEDDYILQSGLKQALSAAGHEAIVAGDGMHADILLATKSFDLLILDLGLPGMDGLAVLQKLRRRKQMTPVLILTARDRTEERVRGLDFGADDYMSKPFELSELEARVRALLRRGQGSLVHLGKLKWSRAHRQASFGGNDLPLSKNEVIILELLLHNPGRIVSKDALAQRIGSENIPASDNTVEVYIHRLRRKLAPAHVEVRTVRGLGYHLSESKQDG